MSDSMKKIFEELLQDLEKDDDFIALKHKYEKPNEFTIMGDKRREEWHSSFICWLLDPKNKITNWAQLHDEVHRTSQQQRCGNIT